jgi:polyphosphate kinase
LKPGIPRVSETVEVRALIDRFLEHGRVFHFTNAGKDEVFLSSADWMPRNFHRRVEAMFPVDDESLKKRLLEILAIQRTDNTKAWHLRQDGKYERVQPQPGEAQVRAQAKFIEMTRERVKSAEAAQATGRFHLGALSRPKLEADGRGAGRQRREGREPRRRT